MAVFDIEAAIAARRKDPQLTVFDTGEMLQPYVWSKGVGAGKVDFDNDESGTELTLMVYPSAVDDETIVLEIDSALLRSLKIVVNDGTIGTVSEDGGFELSQEQA
jgi:hypothetical protein